MSVPTPLDFQAVHRHFSTACFNQAWTLIEKPNRSPEDDQQMVALTFASLYHWTQRPDCTPKNLSIGYWQISRIHAILNRPQEALHYAEICQSHSDGPDPFLRGYALEALARAAGLSGDQARAERAKTEALALLPEIVDEEDRKVLALDLAGI